MNSHKRGNDDDAERVHPVEELGGGVLVSGFKGDMRLSGIAGYLLSFWSRLLRREHVAEVSQQKAMSDFRTFFSDWLADQHPNLQLVAMSHPAHTVLKVDRQEVLLDAGGLLAWHKKSPDTVQRILAGFIEEVVMELRDRGMPLFEDVLDRILPQVRPFSFLEENSPRFGKGRLARLELISELNLLFVIDEGRGMTFVNEGHLDTWGVDEQALQNIALQNLAVLNPNKKLPASFRLEDHSGYAAASILLLDRCFGLQPGESCLAAIPHRDLLVYAPTDIDPGDREALALEVKRLWRNSSRPVYSNLLLCRAHEGGGVELEELVETMAQPGAR